MSPNIVVAILENQVHCASKWLSMVFLKQEKFQTNFTSLCIQLSGRLRIN